MEARRGRKNHQAPGTNAKKSHEFLDHILTDLSFPAVSALTRPVSSASTDCWFAVRLVSIPITRPYLSYTDLIFARSASVKSPQTSASSSTDKRLALLFLYPPFTKNKPSKIETTTLIFGKGKSAHGMAWTDGLWNSYSYALFKKYLVCSNMGFFVSLE
jgi:hypothetical protein